jgi:small subunit ribosomal protein S20
LSLTESERPHREAGFYRNGTADAHQSIDPRLDKTGSGEQRANVTPLSGCHVLAVHAGWRTSGDLVANTKSAEKAARQAQKHRVRNVALRSRMRTAVRSVTAAIAAKNKDSAVATYKEAVPVIDALVNKQIIHRNKAARHKSRLSAQIRAMQ